MPAALPQLVTVNVVAFDSHNQPVTDLSEDDLQVQDQGKRQKILFFQRSESKPRPAVQLGPHEVSNRSSAAPQQATVILLDLMNANLSDRGSGWEGINRSLQHLESADNVYLYLLTAEGRIYPVHGLPGSAGSEDAAQVHPWTQNVRPTLDKAMNTVNRLKPVDDRDPMIRTRETYQALGMLAGQLAAVPGRKNIIWVTHGIPITVRTVTNEWVDMTATLRQFTTNLNRAGIAVYTVDQGGPGSLPPGGGNGGEGPGYQSQDTLQQMADLTGGHSYPGNNVESAVPAAIASVLASYVVVYNPSAQNWDGKFHKLRVTSSRKGIRLQSQTGYAAIPVEPEDRLRADFQAVLSSPVDAAAIGLRASATPIAGAPRSIRYELHIDPADLLLLPNGDHQSTQLAIAFIGVGAPLDTAPVFANVNLTHEQLAAVTRDGLPFTATKTLPEGIQKVRIVVADLTSYRVGTLTMAVPEAGKETGH